MGDIVVVDFGMGNLGSIVNMGRAAGKQLKVSNEESDILAAQRLILPGVGAFDQGIINLQMRGLIPALNEAVLTRGTPILGICLGMQLLCPRSEEGSHRGLGWLAADAMKFQPQNGADLRIPHMGWNTVQRAADSQLLLGLSADMRFYFVHSYHLVCDDENDVVGWTDYGYRFGSAVVHGNIMGVQFHPEKSHRFGLALMRNFLGAN